MSKSLTRASGVTEATSRNLRALFRQVQEIERLMRQDAADRDSDDLQTEFDELLALKKAVDDAEQFMDSLTRRLDNIA